MKFVASTGTRYGVFRVMQSNLIIENIQELERRERLLFAAEGLLRLQVRLNDLTIRLYKAAHPEHEFWLYEEGKPFGQRKHLDGTPIQNEEMKGGDHNDQEVARAVGGGEELRESGAEDHERANEDAQGQTAPILGETCNV